MILKTLAGDGNHLSPYGPCFAQRFYSYLHGIHLILDRRLTQIIEDVLATEILCNAISSHFSYPSAVRSQQPPRTQTLET